MNGNTGVSASEGDLESLLPIREAYEWKPSSAVNNKAAEQLASNS